MVSNSKFSTFVRVSVYKYSAQMIFRKRIRDILKDLPQILDPKIPYLELLISGSIRLPGRMLNSERGKLTITAITIEPAKPSMAPISSHLLYMTMGKVSDYLFGMGTPNQTKVVLASLFEKEKNRFSYQFADVGIVDGDVAGLILAYGHQDMKSLEFPTAVRLLQVMGIVELVRFIGRALPLIGKKEGERGEYFVSNIAVLPKYQGKGMGKQLLFYVEEKARELDFRRIALTVDVDNEGAIEFYKKRGYEIVERVEVKALEKRIGYRGYYRMGKNLG